MGAAYAQHLLDSLGAVTSRPLDFPDEYPALSWARSGLMALTGLPDGEPQMCPVPLAACADGALAALASLAPADVFKNLRGSQLLTERATIAGYTRAGSTSPGGSCRLIEAADGWLALNLARAEDRALLPAWLECERRPDWDSVAQMIWRKPVSELVERGRL
ncbi:MAG: CoA transferase, partial [Nevskiales bacterium]